jgi:hypothetical protein
MLHREKITIPPAKPTSLDSTISDFINDVREDTDFKKNFDYIEEKDQQLKEFIKKGKSKALKPPIQLVVLRKWNSYTPILPSQKEEYKSKGGGYFIRFKHKRKDVGIVIDPGYNFIESFLRAGFKLDDIDHIFVSHAHNDHTVELEGIFSLLNRRNRKSRNPKKVKLYMNLGSFKKFSAYFDLSNPKEEFYIEDIVLLNKHQLIKLNDSIEVFTTQAQHHEMITKNYALGFTFIFGLPNGKRVIKFTCDTGWNEDIEKKNRQEGEQFKIDDIDILISHIGTIKRKELKYDTSRRPKANEKLIQENHLGLIGTVAMINYWKPELVLLSEFGEELNAIRDKIAETIGKLLKTKIFATDLNFRVDLDKLNVMCFKTQTFYPSNEIKTYYDSKDQLYYLNEDKLSPTEKKELLGHLGKQIKVFQ